MARFTGFRNAAMHPGSLGDNGLAVHNDRFRDAGLKVVACVAPVTGQGLIQNDVERRALWYGNRLGGFKDIAQNAL